MGVYKSIMQGLQEAVAYTEGRCPEAIIHIIPNRNLEERESTPPFPIAMTATKCSKPVCVSLLAGSRVLPCAVT